MPLLEQNIGSCHVAKQTAKGSAAATAIKRGRLVGGTLSTNINYGSEPYVDGLRFNSAADFVDTIQGGGTPQLQGQSGLLAYLCYLMLGSETVTGAGPYVHVAVPAATSFWTTWWKSVGSTVVQRERYADCRISQLVIEGSTGQKVLRVTPTIISLDPGEVIASEPVKTDDATEPMLYTEGEGTYTLGGTVIRGHTGFTLTITDDLNPVYGDSVTVFEVANGRGRVGIEATMVLDANGLAEFNKIYYGTATPSAATKPIHTVPAVGTYAFDLTRGATEEFKVEFSGVRWSPPEPPSPNPAGGAATMSFSGEARLVGVNPLVKVTVKNGDAAYT